MNDDAHSILDDVDQVLRQRQRARGFTEYFRVGDLVRFPHGVPWNRTRDYRIVAIYNNGLEVEADGITQAHTDEAAHRLGMTHSPQPTQHAPRQTHLTP